MTAEDTAAPAETAESRKAETAHKRMVKPSESPVGFREPKVSQTAKRCAKRREPKPILSDAKVGLSTLCCVFAVILFTVIFEKGREALKEAAEGGPFEPVLNTLFGELTILGFIGLVAFLITVPKLVHCHSEERSRDDPLSPESTAPNCALMARLSTRIFPHGGEEAGTELPEIFESIHMIIFGNMHVSASDRTYLFRSIKLLHGVNRMLFLIIVFSGLMYAIGTTK